jgi:N-acetylmuramoyl-L-alanine amidase
MLSSAIICLALNIYFEARGEPLVARAAVAYVTTNRLEEKGLDTSKLCQIVYKKGVFSWTKHIEKYNESDSNPYTIQFMQKYKIRERKEWSESLQLAQDVLDKKINNPIQDATIFHDLTVNPKWTKELTFIKKINIFKFYKPKFS